MLAVPLIPHHRSIRKVMLIGMVAALLVVGFLLATTSQAHASTWCYWTGWHTFSCCNSWWPGEQDYQVKHKLCTYDGGRSWRIEETRRRCVTISICDF